MKNKKYIHKYNIMVTLFINYLNLLLSKLTFHVTAPGNEQNQ